MAYEDFKDLTRRTVSDKILRDKAFNIAKNPNCDGYQRGNASVYKFFDKNSAPFQDKSASGGASKRKKMPNNELPKKSHKLIIRKFNKKKYTQLL